jgi:hypothetical protein
MLEFVKRAPQYFGCFYDKNSQNTEGPLPNVCDKFSCAELLAQNKNAS